MKPKKWIKRFVVSVYYYRDIKKITLKKLALEPPAITPYLTLFWLAKSSALSIVLSIFCCVMKAAKLAVYEEIIIKVKNHHIPATMRVDTALATIKYVRILCMSLNSLHYTINIYLFN